MNVFLVKFIAKGLGAVGVGVTGVALGVNHTEEARMASAIKNGKLRPPAVKYYDAAFSQFSASDVKKVIASSDDPKFCGLIGTKDTGKSTELRNFASDKENKNIMYCKVTGDENVELDELLYGTLKKHVITMPGMLSGIRLNGSLSRRDTVKNVFQKVHKNTDELVTMVVDMGYDKHVLKPKRFVDSVRHYVVDARLSRCVFAASDALELQDVSRTEPRLVLFSAAEIPIQTAKKYIQHVSSSDVKEPSEDCLKMFPRTFSSLHRFVEARDKELYAKVELHGEVVKVESSLNSGNIPRVPIYEQHVRKLYKTALTRPITFGDAYAICGLSEEQFITQFVDTDIFQQTQKGLELQFDATRQAVATIVGK
jgi:hypothetical protein